MPVYHQPAPMPETLDAPAAIRPEAPTALAEARSLPADRLLVLLGGASAMVFGLLAFALVAADGRVLAAAGLFGTGGHVLQLVVALAFGLLLLHALTEMARRPLEGAVMALAFGAVLVVFGGPGGMLGGLLALGGAGLAVARRVRWA